jgi:hypothetical protein
MAIPRTPRALALTAALTLSAALGLPAAEAGPRYRGGWDGPAVAQRPVDRSFVQSLWSLLSGFWAKAGSKIDGNG